MAAILRSQQTCFLLKVIPEVEYASQMTISISNILSSWSTDPPAEILMEILILKFDLLLLPGDIVDDGRWICQQDNHEHFKYFELLINPVAEIFMKIY